MKLKINKACDLSSISVLPPRRSDELWRRWSGKEDPFSTAAVVLPGHVSLSQLSRSSFEEATRDVVLKKKITQEKGFFIGSNCIDKRGISATSLKGSWHCLRQNAAFVSDNSFQVSEELVLKLQLIERSINRVGMILDSVQGDVMKVNKAIKELPLEVEGIRQKIGLFNNSMHQLKHHFHFRSAD